MISSESDDGVESSEDEDDEDFYNYGAEVNEEDEEKLWKWTFTKILNNST